MQFAKFKSLFLTFTLAASAALCASAQDSEPEHALRLPGRHAQQQNDLLADQGRVDNQFMLNVAPYLEFENEEEPEDDIYTTGWDSGFVNCYTGVEVPQTAVIDVSHYAMPVPGKLTSPYGWRSRFKRMHRGVDLKLQTGDTVRAAFSGKVRLTKYEGKGYGYYVVIRHNNDLETVYGHLSKFLVKPDQFVKAGEPIALGGNTGRSTGPHLHFETRYMGYAINPQAIFDFENQTTHTDTYTFDKRTYEQPRHYAPSSTYAGTSSKAVSAPAAAPASTNGTVKTYKVKSGDTLSKIATRNGLTVNALCRLNGIKSTAKLQIGQVLRIK